MSKLHDSWKNADGTIEKCRNCGLGFCPEATFCDDIVFSFNRAGNIDEDGKEYEDRYSLIADERHHLKIFHNGKHVYQGITDEEATQYFQRFIKWYTPHTYL